MVIRRFDFFREESLTRFTNTLFHLYHSLSGKRVSSGWTTLSMDFIAIRFTRTLTMSLRYHASPRRESLGCASWEAVLAASSRSSSLSFLPLRRASAFNALIGV